MLFLSGILCLKHCYENFVLQALLRGAVSQQSAVILVCMAIDRYLFLLHPNTYHKHSSKKVRLFFTITISDLFFKLFRNISVLFFFIILRNIIIVFLAFKPSTNRYGLLLF